MLCLLQRSPSRQRSNAIARPDGIGHAANLIGFSTHRAATRRRRTLRMYLRLRLGARLCGALSTLGRGSTGVCQGIGVSSQIVPFPNRSSNAEFVRSQASVSPMVSPRPAQDARDQERTARAPPAGPSPGPIAVVREALAGSEPPQTTSKPGSALTCRSIRSCPSPSSRRGNQQPCRSCPARHSRS